MCRKATPVGRAQALGTRLGWPSVPRLGVWRYRAVELDVPLPDIGRDVPDGLVLDHLCRDLGCEPALAPRNAVSSTPTAATSAVRAGSSMSGLP
jgi:hypothetical protein